MELGGTHEVLSQGAASRKDVVFESDMSLVVGAVLGYSIGCAGGGVAYGGWLEGVGSVLRDSAYAGGRGGEQVWCRSGVIPWEGSSCGAVHYWPWGGPRGCPKSQLSSARGQLENELLAKWFGVGWR